MRLRRSLLALIAAAALVAPATSALSAEVGEPVTAAQVQAAASQVAKDPDLGRSVKRTVLQLRPSEPRKREAPPSGFAWLGRFIRWLVDSARMLVWLAGAVAFALLVVGLRYWIRARADAAAPKRPALPTHVQSLDIRPESLPADVGEAAAALWRSGAQREALSLLYRGALSRLVHDHGVPILAATTEGECTQLASRTLDASRSGFFTRLVAAWQLAVYGGRLPASEDVLGLCRDFGVHFAQAPQPGAAA